MNKQTILTGRLLILAAMTFWLSWFLMPDPGTTDTLHILKIVRQAREKVLYSVIIQILSSILYLLALVQLAAANFPLKKITLAGVALFGIGSMGFCADAFFHLLAYFMTADAVNISNDVVSVMNYMQTKGVIILIPLLLPFFLGSILVAIGLRKQAIITKMPAYILATAIVFGVIGAIISNTVFLYKGPPLSLSVLGIFAAGQAVTGFELIKSSQRGRQHFEEFY